MPAALSVRRLLWLLFVGFLLFFMLSSPTQAGSLFHNVIVGFSRWFVHSAQAFAEFLKSTFG